MPRIRRCPEQNPASSGPPWCTWRRVMKTEFTLYFDGQFWVGVIERHEADRVRAVRIVFGAQPSDAELYEFLLAHANALLSRLDEAAWASDIGQRQATHHNPKRRTAPSIPSRSPRASVHCVAGSDSSRTRTHGARTSFRNQEGETRES